MKPKKIHYNLASLLCAIGIFYFSLIPLPGPPIIYDKLLHGIAYFVLTLILRKSTLSKNALLIAIGYGIIIEILQFSFTKRTFDILDIAANTIGAWLATKI